MAHKSKFDRQVRAAIKLLETRDYYRKIANVYLAGYSPSAERAEQEFSILAPDVQNMATIIYKLEKS